MSVQGPPVRTGELLDTCLGEAVRAEKNLPNFEDDFLKVADDFLEIEKNFPNIEDLCPQS
jgi:hypothetical protein